MNEASGPSLVQVAGLPAREHGQAGHRVMVLHGGPAGAGGAGTLAAGLAGRFRVLEPWQRDSGSEPLTVDRHIADLHAVRAAWAGDEPVALVGESWGAMLALAYAAAHPSPATPLALVGCGTWDEETRQVLRDTLASRTDPALQAAIEALESTVPDASERVQAWRRLTAHWYDVDPLPASELDHGPELFDLRAHTETWDDMVAQQSAGRYPAAFAAVRSPVIMLHGEEDPHPGRLIRDSLLPWLPQLEYLEWAECGHSPWRERRAVAGFFDALTGWLMRRLG